MLEDRINQGELFHMTSDNAYFDTESSRAIYRMAPHNIPKKSITNFCIVLDIDSTLVNTFEYSDVPTIKSLGILENPKLMALRSRIYRMGLEDVLEKKGKGTFLELWGIMRPHLKEFLIFCLSYFKIVVIWSAGRPQYVKDVSEIMFRDVGDPNVVYTSDECVEHVEYIGDEKIVTMRKPLSKLYNDPKLKGMLKPENTFIIDDRIYSFAEDPENGILIPPYNPDVTVESMLTDDQALLQLMFWFSKPEVKNSDDVRKLSKREIFLTSLRDYGFSLKM